MSLGDGTEGGRAPRVPIRLRPGEDRRLRAGHPWVFADECEALPEGLTAGDEVAVEDARGSFIGAGFIHPGASILVRLHERRPGQQLDDRWWQQRLGAAFDRRAVVRRDRTAFRWVFADADHLPGLIVDRFDGQGRRRAVMAIQTAGVERHKERIIETLRSHFGIDDLVVRSDGRGRALEGLESEAFLALGEGGPWAIDDDGRTVVFDPLQGQKTGLFLDMWENRRRMAPYLQGRVADLFCYVGQWALAAVQAGATEVHAVDRSADAVRWAQESAARGGAADRITTHAADVERFLSAQTDQSFDAIVCDPPAFVPHKRALEEGVRAYTALYGRTLQKVRRGGFAVLASCSHHLDSERFEAVLKDAARRAGRRLHIVLWGGQAPCHPVPLSFPQGRYLKTVLVEVE